MQGDGFRARKLDDAADGRRGDGAGALKADPALTPIPILMMSAASEEHLRVTLREYNAFLRKPFQAGTRVDLVRQVLPLQHHRELPDTPLTGP